MAAALVLTAALAAVAVGFIVKNSTWRWLTDRIVEVDEHEHVVREPAVTDGNPHPSVTRPRFPATETQTAIVRRLQREDPIREDGAS